MAVEVLGMPGETNGYGDSMDAFRNAHETNSRVLLNLANGRPKNATTPAHDHNHPDNRWPVMMYHPEKGSNIVGLSLAGTVGVVRTDREESNREAVETLLKLGWRMEPYQKVQIALLDPATEKAALVAKNRELEGQIVSLTDTMNKILARMDAAALAKPEKGGK